MGEGGGDDDGKRSGRWVNGRCCAPPAPFSRGRRMQAATGRRWAVPSLNERPSRGCGGEAEGTEGTQRLTWGGGSPGHTTTSSSSSLLTPSTVSLLRPWPAASPPALHCMAFLPMAFRTNTGRTQGAETGGGNEGPQRGRMSTKAARERRERLRQCKALLRGGIVEKTTAVS